MQDSTNNAENKILILYALAQARYSMTKHDLSLIMLDNLLMNYYNFSDSIYGLKDGRFIIQEKKANDEFIEITDSGKSMLDIFYPTQDKRKLGMIDKYMTEMRDQLIEKNTVIGFYHPIDINRYMVQITAKEGRKIIFDLSIEVSTEAEAKQIIDHWKSAPEEIYKEFIELLLNKD